MPMTIEIKEASPADAPAILGIMQDAFYKYEHDLGMTGHVTALKETEEDIERDIREKTVLVGYINGVAVGSVRVEIMGDLAYLSRFGVRTENTKSGIGGMLINEVDNICREASESGSGLRNLTRSLSGLFRRRKDD